jgi:hypothetical protein
MLASAYFFGLLLGSVLTTVEGLVVSSIRAKVVVYEPLEQQAKTVLLRVGPSALGLC